MLATDPRFNALKTTLDEFLRRIKEDDYSIEDEDFEVEFYKLREFVEEAFHEAIDEEERDALEEINNTLDEIRDEQGLYNEEDELERLFPNGNEDDFDN